MTKKVSTCDRPLANRAMKAMVDMGKIDIARMEAAYNGKMTRLKQVARS